MGVRGRALQHRMFSPSRAVDQIVTALLREAGILCKVAIFPVARRGEEALRFSLTASHTEAQLDQLEAALRGIASGVRRVAA